MRTVKIYDYTFVLSTIAVCKYVYKFMSVFSQYWAINISVVYYLTDMPQWRHDNN